MSLTILWAFAACFWLAATRLLQLWRKYPAFATFVAIEAARQAWFLNDFAAYRKYYQLAEIIQNILGVAVCVEAYLILANQVRSFDWKWRVFAIIALPAVPAAAMAHDLPSAFRMALYFNQVAGLGLGGLMLATAAGAWLPMKFTRNSKVHSACLAALWITSGAGAWLYNHELQNVGRWFIGAGPASAMLAWTIFMMPGGESKDYDPELRISAAHKRVDEDIERARKSGLIK